MQVALVHPFEKTLGQGPYQYLGMVTIIKPSENMPEGNYRQLGMLTPTRFIRGMGTCAHCGMAIMNVFFVQVGNGDVYGVGSDCIHKAGLPPSEIRKLSRDEAKHQKDLRVRRKNNKIENAWAELEEICYTKSEEMAKLPHPSIYGKTLMDYVEWVKANVSNPIRSLDTVKRSLSV